jgi:hypothetical protein
MGWEPPLAEAQPAPTQRTSHDAKAQAAQPSHAESLMQQANQLQFAGIFRSASGNCINQPKKSTKTRNEDHF